MNRTVIREYRVENLDFSNERIIIFRNYKIQSVSVSVSCSSDVLFKVARFKNFIKAVCIDATGVINMHVN